jgi:hypothetical protein
MKPMTKNQNRVVTVSGIILPTEWDEKGDVTGVAIHTFDEEKYYVENLNERSELLAQLRTRMKVTGILKRGADGNRFTIKGYKIENSD